MKIQEERVLLLMEENGITQRKMAQDLAISPTTLNGYLHGKYLHVPDDVIREIADYLQVSVDYITDRSALLQIGNGIHDKEEAVVFDNYRHLRPSDKKIAADLISRLQYTIDIILRCSFHMKMEKMWKNRQSFIIKNH